MANIDLTNVGPGITAASPGLVEFSSIFSSAPNLFAWTSTTGDIVFAEGSGLTYDASGYPTGGTITEITISIGVPATNSIGISNFSVGILDLLASGISFWETVLAGVTDFGTIAEDHRAFGDFVDITSGFAIGDDDVFDGDGGFPAQAFGDADDIQNAVLTAGSDTFTGAFQWVVGDVGSVTADATLYGGNDIITFDEAYSAAGYAQVHGDVSHVEDSVLNGGDDNIYTADSASVQIHGDAEDVFGASTINGGNDHITFAFGSAYGDFQFADDADTTITAGDDTFTVTALARNGFVYGDGLSTGGTFTGGIDTIHGGEFADLLYGDLWILESTATAIFGSDIINGNGGNDNLYGDVSPTRVSVGATIITWGDDTLNGGEGNDTLYGNGGNDTLNGGENNDTLYGGAGDDDIDGGTGIDTASYRYAAAGVEVDLNLQGIQQDTVGDGLDTLSNIENLAGSDFDDVLNGDLAANLLVGGDGNDTMRGKDGHDNLRGEAGNDVLSGGAGNDVVNGDDGQDLMYGGSGNDLLFGGDGSDQLFGGAGTDEIFGGDQNDIVNGGAENDIINTGADDDLVFAQNGNDLVFAQSGNDTVFGGKGNDTIFGGDGDDEINGGAGNDEIFGGANIDIITGAGGNDILSGGGDGDVFIFAASQGDDTIIDYTGADTLDISAFGVVDGAGSNQDWRDATTSVGPSGGGLNVTITWDGGGTLVLENTTVASLTDDDFAF